MKHSLALATMLGLMGSLAAPAYAYNSHVEEALATQGYLSIFNQAFHETGVAAELNENVKYAIFAPTNAAFATIHPCAFPCFYSTLYRNEVAAIVRNHIVPINDGIDNFSRYYADPLPTLGARRIDVEKTFPNNYTKAGHRTLYSNDYTAEGFRVLYQNRNNEVSLYPINGVIVSQQEMVQLHANRSSYADCVGSRWLTSWGQQCGAPSCGEQAASCASGNFAGLSQKDRTVYFQFNRSNLTPEAKERLDTLAKALKSNESVGRAKIVGFADRIGSVDYNQRLSQKRAKTVLNYLVANGYTKASVTETRWVGESEPSTKCPAEARAKLIECLHDDRKVEVEVDCLGE